MELTVFNEKQNYNDDIFHMFDMEANDIFSDMSERELGDFLLLLEGYHMFYRDRLNVDKKNTFATEIECARADILEINRLLKNSKGCKDWIGKSDLSLREGKEIVNVNGVDAVLKAREYNTDILNNTKWDDLYEGCSIISNNAFIDSACGGHVHVGAHILGVKKQNWIDFFQLWSAYEDVAYRFSSGEENSFREGGINYAFPVSQDWQKNLKRVSTNLNFDRLIDVFGKFKGNAINLKHVDKYNVRKMSEGNTVEFRAFNGCLNPIIIQNNINFAVHMMEYATDKNYDDIKIHNRKEELADKFLFVKGLDFPLFYDNINLAKSIELADMIFSNNLDKINFLKQCVKSLDCFDYSDEKVMKKTK